MRRRSIGQIIGAALAAALVCAIACAGGSYETTGVKAIDGDSVKVRMPSGLEVEVRLLSVDAPEHGQPFADEAKAFSEKWIAGRSVRLITGERERDRYNRLLAFVDSDDGALNTDLVRAGFAVVWVIPPNTERTDALLEAQRLAHEAGIGIWAAEGEMLEPRDHRHREEVADTARRLQHRQHVVVGNARSQVAHWPGCTHPAEMAQENVVYFDDVADALEAGFRMERGQR
jgi:micrococcal nuclease